jgi:hypothetical protein
MGFAERRICAHRGAPFAFRVLELAIAKEGAAQR